MQPFVRIYDLRRGEFCDLPDAHFVLALGNFDGVHAAHMSLLLRAARLAQGYGLKSAAWCFDPPSSAILLPSQKQLCTLQEKLSLLSNCGLDYVFLADFTSLRHLSPSEFILDVLQKRAHAVRIVCGFHFHFGKGGVGDTTLLQRFFGNDCVDIIPPVCIPLGGQTAVISSSAVRASLTQGNASDAARLLGRPYSLTAPVVHGKALGRTLGFPTVNQQVPTEKLMPKQGIYATCVDVGDEAYFGVTNVGVRPTVDAGDSLINCETHILDLNRDLYGQTVTVKFMHRLRDEQRFDSLDELQSAISQDIEHTKAYFEK